MNRYEELAERLRADIRNGLYPPGTRVPSIRRASQTHGVSAATSVAAYRHLEAQGWLEARPQSGYFARVPGSLPPAARLGTEDTEPAPVSLGERVLALRRAASRPDLVPLGTAVPDAAFLPLADVNACLARVVRTQPALAAGYGPLAGDRGLRVQLARRAAEAGCAVTPDDLIVTTGCQEALMLALRAVAQPGDVIAIESPAYFGTLQIIESLGLKALEIPTDAQTGMSPEALALAIERWPVRAALVVSSFSNPCGATLPDAAKRRIVRLLAAKNIPLIDDDIYGDLHFGPARPHPAKAFDARDNVILCSSVSKTIGPGLRVGWMVPGKWRARVEELKFGSTQATALHPQLALAGYLATSKYERHLVKVRRAYAENLARAHAAVARHFPTGTRCSRPQGGFILWAELPEEADALEIAHRALRAGISIAPGPLFSATGKYANCLRLAVGQRWDARIDNALAELGRISQAALRRR